MDINIKTTLGINPRQKPNELLIITRGATAKIDYNLADKWFSYDILEQLVFSFKQKKKLRWYAMFKYLVLTEDTEIDESKNYYKNVRYIDVNKSYECTADLVADPMDNPLAAGYYEEVLEPEEGQNNLRYIIDSHFGHIKNSDADYIVFMLSPQETSLLSPTSPGAEMQFEITVRLNTDGQEELINHDSTIIEKQPRIIVNDSLYGQVSADTNTVADSPEVLASVRRSVRE